MKWHKETINILGTPDDIQVYLIGYYNDKREFPLKPRIEIKLEAMKDKKLVNEIVLYSHDPVLLRYEEPDSDDIRDRYGRYVIKVAKSAMSNDYASLFSET